MNGFLACDELFNWNQKIFFVFTLSNTRECPLQKKIWNWNSCSAQLIENSVSVEGEMSIPTETQAGVPQGSVLSPI